MHDALARLVVTHGTEADHTLTLEGRLPNDLAGTLYRIGPGLFGRSPQTSGHALDGDGFVQRFAVGDGVVHYRSRFVRTAKYTAEERAESMLFPTWSRRAPGLWRNVGARRMRSQAGVTVLAAGAELLARDEVGQPWRLHPVSLETLGEGSCCAASRGLTPKAHIKTCPRTGEQWLLACEYGRRMAIHLMVQHGGRLSFHRRVLVPRQVYIHDYFLTEHFAVVIFHPAVLRPLRFVLGLAAFCDCLTWQPDLGNLWLVFPRSPEEPARWFDGPPGWMWHGVRAAEKGRTLIVDWVAYDEPDHFLGPDPALRAILHGRQGRADHPGKVRRTTLNLMTGRVSEEIAIDGNFEFPVVNENDDSAAFVTVAAPGTILSDGIARVMPDRGAVQSFRFGEGVYVGEPIPSSGLMSGWVLTVGVHAPSARSFVAFFRSHAIADGPAVVAWLDMAMPGSFHGLWLSG